MNISALLARTRLFTGIEPAALELLAARTAVCGFRSGETVFEVGSEPDCIYIVAAGRLRVDQPDGRMRGDIGRLDYVGEVGLLAQRPRSAHIYAVRDSYLLRIERDDLLALLREHPDALLALSRAVIERLEEQPAPSAAAQSRQPRCIAVIAANPNLDAPAFAALMREALSRSGACEMLEAGDIDAVLGAGFAETAVQEGAAENLLIEHLYHLESTHRHLIFVGDREPSLWSQRCMRHCDRVLVLADVRHAPSDSPMLASLRNARLRVPIELVLLRPEDAYASDVLRWRELCGARAHYFARPGHRGDAAFVARNLTGRALGLVLGGGGARGFAHIGLLRALEELKLPIDLIGGTSMGAYLGALSACGYGWQDVQDIARDTFVKQKLLNDYLLPRIALIRGKRFYQRLKEDFGERHIEQLLTPFFCVSTNLTRGSAMVHDRGLLSAWVATSMAVPGVVPPVSYQGDLLVDGAVINSLPTDVMQDLERGPILASNVSTAGTLAMPGIEGPDPDAVLHWSPMSDDARKPTLVSILFRTATLTSESGLAAREAKADAFLRPPVSNVAMFDWKRLDEVAARGYEYAMSELPKLKELLQPS